MDGTFKIVPDFLKPRGQISVTPWFRQKRWERTTISTGICTDVIKAEVFSAILEALPARPAVEMFMVDFELGMHIPLVPVRMEAHPGSGPCSHIHEEGGYSSLPEAAYGIPDIEGESQQRAPQSLVGYIDRQWMNHSVFHPSSWTVYRQAVRTNNDVEGWHHRVNSKAGHRGCTFYKLIPLLLHEAKLVVTRVSSENLFRDVRQSSSATQKKLTEAWEQYDAGQLSTGHFLRLCGTVYAPCE
nr:uncharacterized protein LOC105322593 [Crassostrea gigas]